MWSDQNIRVDCDTSGNMDERTDYNIRDAFSIALFAGFDYSKGNKILVIGEDNTASKELITEYFENRKLSAIVVSCNDIDNISESEIYDYVLVTSSFEKVLDKKSFLKSVKSILKPNGSMFLVLNNPLGLRYLIGDKDPYTYRNFDSIEEYIRINAIDKANLKGQMIDRAEIDCMLDDIGFSKSVQFSVFPNLEYPQLIYREDTLPNEEISSRIFPVYNSPDTIFLDEYALLKKFARNGMFHQFANAYIIECSLDDRHEAVMHATINMNRGRDRAMSTVIKENGIVEKTAIFSEGRASLVCYKENHDDLRKRGVNAIPVEFVNGCASTEYVEGVGGIEYFANLFNRVDCESFIAKVDEFRDIILKSSDYYVDDKTTEIILKNGYPDLALINCIYKDDIPYIIDQEYVIPDLPAKVLILRLVDYVYFGNYQLAKELPRSFFDERYGLTDNPKKWRDKLYFFMCDLKNQNELQPFYESHCTNPDIINANRQRMNYSQEEYKKLFDDIFADVDGRELYLFGSGLFAERFINLYGRFFVIKGIIDNNAEKWGTAKNDIEILPPEQIFKKNPSEYKIIICIKNYNAVLSQLKAAGVKNISVFDPNAIYDLKREAHKTSDLPNAAKGEMESHSAEDAQPKKKYNVGYIAGVFDLFHIGHLNLLRRAKEQCNHLIVGVVNDEAVIKNKRVEPFVPFEERIEMVRACKYVDEAVEITYTNAGTRDAFRLYHFDVQFSGSDYVNNGNWLAEKEFLEKHGSELVFFPYTEQTSSSKIKRLIEEKLM